MKRRVVKGFRYGDPIYIPQFKYPWYLALLYGKWDWQCHYRLGADDRTFIAFKELDKAIEYTGVKYEVMFESN